MKILFVCYEFPSPVEAGSLRVLHSVRYLAEKYGHDITLVSFKLPGMENADLNNYCHFETVEIARRPGFESPGAMLSALRQVLRPRHLLSEYPAFYYYSYSERMAEKVSELIDNNKFDVMALDTPQMICYTDERVPPVLLETFAISEMALNQYQLERNWLKKAVRLLYYYQTRNYAETYRKVKACVAVSSQQKDAVKAHSPDLDITVIPHGIDADYLHAVEPEAEFPCLVISGSMSGLRNETVVLHFYREIFARIRARVPDVKLYIVGRNPGEKIRSLAKDAAVVVTGYVDDLRPYLSRAWVVVAPLQEGFGVKIRVLQAMAVGKPVVATSMVSTGIDVSSGENIILADVPLEFADRVIELLNDKELRERLGSEARRLMETNHNWEKLTDKLNEVLEKAAGAKTSPEGK